ncbi:hypothetical protein IID22_01440 [Patescibacteria group bacterium]|nr:hypothetical protein [Patescibacteria group bacterium]
MRVTNERQSKQETSSPLTGERVASITEDLYQRVPPIVGAHLVESNIVINIAGLKGYTEFIVRIPTEDNLEVIDEAVIRLNQGSEKERLRFSAVGDVFELPGRKKQKALSIGMQNLSGFELVSQKSQLPGVYPFNRFNGFDGLRSWKIATAKAIQKSQEEGLIPKQFDSSHMQVGLYLGYPDTALLDFADWLANNRERQLQRSDIPFTGIYQEAEHNFYFYPEHSQDPTILESIRNASEILREFYESDWHQEVSQDPSFTNEREEYEAKIIS